MCELCLKTPCIDPRCPGYIPPRAKCHCSFCGEGIIDGDEYIENENGEYRHYECFSDLRELLEWLGYEIRTMEDIYE